VLPDQIAAILAEYRYWSRAERRILPTITDNVIRYFADGDGSTFTQLVAEYIVRPKLAL